MIWLIVAFLFLAAPASAVVSFDNSPTPATNATGGITSIAQNITVSGGCANSYLEATVMWKGFNGAITTTASTSGTGGGGMTDSGQGQKAANNDPSGQDRYVQRFYRVGATGLQTVTATFTGGAPDQAILVTASYCGVDQSTSVGTAASATGYYFVTPTVSVTVSTGGLATDGMVMTYDASTMTAASPQVQLVSQLDIGTYSAASYKTGCSGTCSMTWNCSVTADCQPWAIIAIPVNPAAGGGVARRRVVIVQ